MMNRSKHLRLQALIGFVCAFKIRDLESDAAQNGDATASSFTPNAMDRHRLSVPIGLGHPFQMADPARLR